MLIAMLIACRLHVDCILIAGDESEILPSTHQCLSPRAFRSHLCAPQVQILCKLMKPASVMLLDEITTDLDLLARQVQRTCMLTAC